MYINPFVAGVLTTLFVEISVVLVYSVIKYRKEKKNGR